MNCLLCIEDLNGDDKSVIINQSFAHSKAKLVMKKLLFIFSLLATMLVSSVCMAAEISSDKMILEWNSNKVWMVGDELCVQGTFTNKRADLRITELKEIVMRFVFTLDDGTKITHIAQPKKLPMCKIPPCESKRLTFNFGKYDGPKWHKWLTDAECTFCYQDGMRW